MKLLKTKKLLGIILISILGLINVGCSERVSAVDNEKLKTSNQKIEKDNNDINASDTEEAKNVMIKVEEFISELESESLVKNIMGNDNWKFVEVVSILEDREGHLIQHVETDADFRFVVDRKTGEVFCEKSTLPGEYELVKSIEEVNSYLVDDESNVEIQAIEDIDANYKEDSNNKTERMLVQKKQNSLLKMNISVQGCKNRQKLFMKVKMYGRLNIILKWVEKYIFALYMLIVRMERFILHTNK